MEYNHLLVAEHTGQYVGRAVMKRTQILRWAVAAAAATGLLRGWTSLAEPSGAHAGRSELADSTGREMNFVQVLLAESMLGIEMKV